MAINVSIVAGAPSGSAVANQTMGYVVTIANTGASSLTLNSLFISASPPGVRVGQPTWLTPNAPVGVGNPTIGAASSVSYSFGIVFTNPVMPGPSPQAPGGAEPSNAAYYPNADFTLMATVGMSDGTISSGTIVVPVLSATFPQSNGGALVMSQGFNLINLVTL